MDSGNWIHEVSKGYWVTIWVAHGTGLFNGIAVLKKSPYPAWLAMCSNSAADGTFQASPIVPLA